MKKTIFSAAALALSLTGCATAMSPVNGALYTETKGPGFATTAFGPNAQGEACASSILGIVATGDASIDAAKKAGGIAQVVSVDYSASSILGIFAKSCTIVHGKRGGGAPAAKAAE